MSVLLQPLFGFRIMGTRMDKMFQNRLLKLLSITYKYLQQVSHMAYFLHQATFPILNLVHLLSNL